MTTPRFLHGAVCLVLLAVGIAPLDGYTVQRIAAAALLVALAVEAATSTRRPSLKLVWILGYLMIVSREAIWGAEEAESLAGPEYYDLACRYLSAAAGAVLFGHLFTSEPRTAAPVQGTSLRPNPFAVAFVLGMGVLFLALQLPKVTVMIDTGRTGRFGSTTEIPLQDVSGVLIGSVMQTAGLAMPAMIAYLSTRVYRWPTIAPFLLATPILATLFFLGSRFPLLFSAAGFALVMLPRRVDRAPVRLYLGILATVLLSASVLMARVRGEGFHQLAEQDLVRSEGPLIHYEGCVAWLAFLMRYIDTHGLLYGRSIGGVLIFWIPRALWENKPTMIGYWLPRIVEENFAGGHSVSLTFAGNMFADFGFAGGLIVCWILGLLFGVLEVWTRRLFDERWDDPKIVIAGVLYGATYLSVRSADTALISMTGVICAAYILLSHVRVRPVALRAPNTPGSAGARPV